MAPTVAEALSAATPGLQKAAAAPLLGPLTVPSSQETDDMAIPALAAAAAAAGADEQAPHRGSIDVSGMYSQEGAATHLNRRLAPSALGSAGLPSGAMDVSAFCNGVRAAFDQQQLVSGDASAAAPVNAAAYFSQEGATRQQGTLRWAVMRASKWACLPGEAWHAVVLAAPASACLPACRPESPAPLPPAACLQVTSGPVCWHTWNGVAVGRLPASHSLPLHRHLCDPGGWGQCSDLRRRSSPAVQL